MIGHADGDRVKVRGPATAARLTPRPRGDRGGVAVDCYWVSAADLMSLLPGTESLRRYGAAGV